MTMAVAPSSRAWGAKLLPLNRSPLSAKKICPDASVRESEQIVQPWMTRSSKVFLVKAIAAEFLLLHLLCFFATVVIQVLESYAIHCATESDEIS